MKKIATSVFCIALALLFITAKTANAQGIMTTCAGDTTVGYSGDGGPANLAHLSGPWGVCFDASYNLYITDFYDNVIRKVDATTGIISTIAGIDSAGYTGDGGLATSAQLDEPEAICVDAVGNIYFVAWYDNVIRKIDGATGIITTIAGYGVGSGSPGIADPGGMCVDPAGRYLYFADMGNNMIRKIDLANDSLITVAGTGTAGYTGDNGLATLATFDRPEAVCMDASGNLYVADHDNFVIRKINATTGVVTTIAGNGTNGFTGDNGPALSAEIGSIYGMACDGHGDIYICDWSCSCRRISCSSGNIYLQAGEGIASGYNGDGGCDTLETLATPVGVCVDPRNGNVIIADLSNHCVRMATQPGYIPTTAVSTVAATAQFSIYPNPSTGIFTIQTANHQNAATVEIYNSIGGLVYTATFTGLQKNIDISTQPAGLYFVNTITESGTQTDAMVIK